MRCSEHFWQGWSRPRTIYSSRLLRERVESVTLVLLLPLFFVYNGLRTSIGLINGMDLWLTCAIIIAVAVASKFVLPPCAFAPAALGGANRWQWARW